MDLLIKKYNEEKEKEFIVKKTIEYKTKGSIEFYKNEKNKDISEDELKKTIKNIIKKNEFQFLNGQSNVSISLTSESDALKTELNFIQENISLAYVEIRDEFMEEISVEAPDFWKIQKLEKEIYPNGIPEKELSVFLSFPKNQRAWNYLYTKGLNVNKDFPINFIKKVLSSPLLSNMFYEEGDKGFPYVKREFIESSTAYLNNDGDGLKKLVLIINSSDDNIFSNHLFLSMINLGLLEKLLIKDPNSFQDELENCLIKKIIPAIEKNKDPNESLEIFTKSIVSIGILDHINNKQKIKEVIKESIDKNEKLFFALDEFNLALSKEEESHKKNKSIKK